MSKSNFESLQAQHRTYHKIGLVRKDNHKDFINKYKINLPSDVSLILLKIRPSAISYVAFMFPLLVGLVAIFPYIFEGRYSGYLPTISETGTEYPNKTYLAHAMSTGATAVLLTLAYCAVYYKFTFNPSESFYFFLKCMCITSFVGILGVGSCPVNEVHDIHLSFAALGFSSILFFEIIVLSKEKPILPVSTFRFRLMFILIGFVGFFAFGASKFIFDPRHNVTISTIGEWILLFCMLYGLTLWREEIDSIEIHIALLDNEKIE